MGGVGDALTWTFTYLQTIFSLDLVSEPCPSATQVAPFRFFYLLGCFLYCFSVFRMVGYFFATKRRKKEKLTQ